MRQNCTIILPLAGLWLSPPERKLRAWYGYDVAGSQTEPLPMVELVRRGAAPNIHSGRGRKQTDIERGDHRQLQHGDDRGNRVGWMSGDFAVG
jgi:hypothetical protein